jgi:hypothetical protein
MLTGKGLGEIFRIQQKSLSSADIVVDEVSEN